MPKSLLDLMPKQEREKAIERGKKRLERNKSRKAVDVSPEIFLIAEALYYGDWDMVRAIRRGYTIEEDLDAQGNLIYQKHVLTLEEVQVLLEGARKVWYSKLVEQTHSGMVSNSFKTSSKTFNDAVKSFADRAEVKS
jgi:hypothetical protein